jgi:putative salt-induced outer membrane protein YdiY
MRELKISIVTVFLFSFMTANEVRAGELLTGWDGSVFAGYNQTTGNTEKAAANIKAEALRSFERSEFSLKGGISYSETDNNMDTQKWDALVRYSRDLGNAEQWYNFYQINADHDYFADIYYRVTPGVGLGHHLFNSEKFTWDIDAGLGYRVTRHRVNTATDDEVMTALVHTFAKKRILQNGFLSEDFTIYPGLENDAGYVLKSETTFTNPISESIDLQIKYIVDYDSSPAEDKKKTDIQFITGIAYKF